MLKKRGLGLILGRMKQEKRHPATIKKNYRDEKDFSTFRAQAQKQARF
jgi:hypothetical protein